MKKISRFCLLILAFTLLLTLSACDTSSHTGCHRMTFWWTDSDGQVVNRFSEGCRYTANIQIEALRSHEDLAICVSHELLSNGLTVKPNGSSASFTISINDLDGSTCTTKISVGPAKDQTSPISMRYLSGTARLESEFPQDLTDEDLFALGALIGNTTADGNLRKGESCRVTFDVMVEGHPEPVTDDTSDDVATDGDHSWLTLMVCGVLLLAVSVTLAIALYHNKTLRDRNVILDSANESLSNKNNTLAKESLEAKNRCQSLERKLNYLKRGISESIATNLGADGFITPDLIDVVSRVDGDVIEVAHLADQIRILRAHIGMYLADQGYDDIIVVGALLLGGALGIVTPGVVIYNRDGRLSNQAKVELQKVYDEIARYAPDDLDTPTIEC